MPFGRRKCDECEDPISLLRGLYNNMAQENRKKERSEIENRA